MRFLIQTTKEGELGYLAIAIAIVGLGLAFALAALIAIVGYAASGIDCQFRPDTPRCTLLYQRDQASRL